MRILFKFFIIILLFSCNKNEEPQEKNDLNCSGDYSTAGILVDINEEIYNDDESVISTVDTHGLQMVQTEF